MKYCQNIPRGEEKSSEQQLTDILYIPALLPGCSNDILQGNSQGQMNTDITYKHTHDAYNRSLSLHKAQWKLTLALVIALLMCLHCAENIFLSQLTDAILMAAESDILVMNVIICIFWLDFGVSMLISSLRWVIYLPLSCLHQF